MKQSTNRGVPRGSATRVSRVRMPGRAFSALALPLVLLLAAGVGLGAAALPSDASAPTATPSVATPPEAPAATADPPTTAPTDPPTTAPPTTPPPSQAPIADPRIASPSAGDTLGGAVTIRGSAEPGSDIQVQSSTQSDPLCTVSADSDGSFACSSSGLPSGPNVQLSVVQLVSGYDDKHTAIAVNVLNSPTLSSGSNGPVSTGYGTVRGTAYPGATVNATAAAYSCSGIADGQGSWACNLGTNIPSGTLRVAATQTTGWSNGASSASDTLTLQIDSTVPSPPVVTSPKAGATVAQVGSISGTGENGALVTVFAGTFAACTATVQGTAWSCTTGTVPAGSFGVSAMQQDAAGNVSDESTPFTVTFSASGVPTPSASASGSATGSGSGASTATATPIPNGNSSPSPSGAASGSGSGTPGSGGASSGGGGSATAPGGGTGSAGGSGGSSGGQNSPGDGAVTPAAPAPDTWASATRFTAALQPVLSSSPLTTWLIALAAALAAIVLIAAPGRLLAAALARRRGRDLDSAHFPALVSPASAGSASPRSVSPRSVSPIRGIPRLSGLALPTGRPRGALDAATRTRLLRSTLKRSRFTGRNRPTGDFDSAFEITFSPWLIASACVLLSAAIGMLSGPVAGQPAYLRLFVAISVAFAALNAVAVVLPRVLARRWLGVTAQLVVSPRYLLVAVALSVISRLLDLQPALLFGIVLSLVTAVGLSRRQAARLAGLQLGALLGLGTVAWLALVWLPGIAGANATANPVAALANETLTTIVLGAFGATAVLVLPFGSLAGRAVYEWSKPIWLGLTLVSFTLLAAVVAPSFEQAGRSFALAQTVVIAVAFAAVSLSVWVWYTFIAPTLDDPAPDDRPLSNQTRNNQTRNNPALHE
ncbi:hypothetical protein [Subtercola endophyticus]|uniref:hypothetical protein n=1 Tax=Subtercola endophyticus TaxID=2895559 RepID=UPI001E37AC82|nr:hypothetical protein [Subtercola endophyticus]UFS59850.1 hypothetical protein LQ955_03380 [Subtercola endophyticus]